MKTSPKHSEEGTQNTNSHLTNIKKIIKLILLAKSSPKSLLLLNSKFVQLGWRLLNVSSVQSKLFGYGMTFITPDRWQSNALLPIDEHGSKIAGSSVFDCHLSPSRKWQSKTLFIGSSTVFTFTIASNPLCSFFLTFTESEDMPPNPA